MNRQPWEKDPVMENITASMMTDAQARGLRRLGPVFYHGDATFREIMIKLQVMNHRASLPWWAR